MNRSKLVFICIFFLHFLCYIYTNTLCDYVHQINTLFSLNLLERWLVDVKMHHTQIDTGIIEKCLLYKSNIIGGGK